MKQKLNACLLSYPPKYYVIIPPAKQPKVGAVIEITENTVLTFF
jgi:hypothetical protein